jgi:hypothetical protein
MLMRIRLWRMVRLDRRITHAQGYLHAAIANKDEVADAVWSRKVTRLMAKRATRRRQSGV